MEPSRLPQDLMIRPFSRQEALARGVTPRRLRAQDLWTPTPGVRTVEIPLTLLDRARAFAVVAPSDFAFARATAARLHGIPLPQDLEKDPFIHIVTRTADNRVRRLEVVGHRGLETRRVVEIAGLPVVSPADTWVDLGGGTSGPGVLSAWTTSSRRVMPRRTSRDQWSRWVWRYVAGFAREAR
ncbi:hypothetical protein [Humibacillus xanthopallidus]|uniref:hypothetical protein n=1 Tax=Humibacillus xanthopallidus TaxID=412689 RepID=UPI00384B441B